MPFSARTSRHNLIASLMFSTASSFVFPWLTHPGIDGHSTTNTPSSSRSIVTLKIIYVSFLFHPLRDELRECSPAVRHLVNVGSQCCGMEKRECANILPRDQPALRLITV